MVVADRGVDDDCDRGRRHRRPSLSGRGAGPRVFAPGSRDEDSLRRDLARDRVVVDRTRLDGRPFVISNVPPGLVKYQLNLDQHESADLVGVVTNRQQLVLRATLRHVRVDDGLVEFDSDPAGAKIFEQGKFLTETPARKSMAST